MKQNINNLIRDYNAGKTITEIASRQGVSRTTIRKKLRDNNVYGKREIEPNFRKYICNENYFKIIDCPNKAYWLGFIAADGYIHKDNKRLTIELHIKDISILEQFVSDINSTHPIKKKKIKNLYRNNTLKQDYYHHCLLQLWSPILVNDIMKYGITNNKSLSMKFPTMIPIKFLNNFMLGYFDGDGCVTSWSNGKKPQLLFRVVGNLSFVHTYQQILMANCSLNKTKLQTEGKAYSVCYGGNKQCKRIYNFLYDNHQMCLQRKKNKFDSVFSIK